MRLTLISLFLFWIIIPTKISAFYGEKYEPSDGKTYHGLGQYMPFYYTDTENWQQVFDYQTAIAKIPTIYSVYYTIHPDHMSVNPNLTDLATKHGYDYYLLIGISYINPDGTINATDIISGLWDNEIRELALKVKNINAPVFIRPGFEFGSGSDGIHSGLTGSEFIAIWNRIYSIFSNEAVSNVAWVWNTVNPNQFNYMQYYPGDEKVDWWGINYFTTSQMNNGAGFLTAANSHAKPVMICESNPIESNGTDNQSNWQNWFIPYFNNIESKNIKAFVYISDSWDKIGFFDWWPNSQIEAGTLIAQNYASRLSNSRYLHFTNDRDLDGDLDIIDWFKLIRSYGVNGINLFKYNSWLAEFVL